MTARTSTPALESQNIEVANVVKDATLSPASTTTNASRMSFDRILQGKKVREPYWPAIGTKDEIPRWLQDNDFIVGGHSKPTHSYRRSFRLWRSLHMATMNIWTHIIGGVALIGAGITLCRYAPSRRLDLTTGDKFAFGISMTAAATYFGLSTAFHTLRIHSCTVHHRWGHFDIFGIRLLAPGGSSSATYYAAHCNPIAQRVYWGLDGAAALAAAAVLFDTGGGGKRNACP